MVANSKIRWAFNSATIMNCPWEEELPLWQEFGWNAAEIWYSKLEPELAKGRSLEQLKRQMNDAGVNAIGMCAGTLLTSQSADPEAEISGITHRLDAAAAMDARSLTVVILGQPDADIAGEYRYQAERLRRVAELAAARGLRVNLEFLATTAINATMGSAIELVNTVDHPALGVLLDFCHYYLSPSHFEELSLLSPEKLFLVHVNDVRRYPMEALQNNHRTFPGEGRMDVVSLLEQLHNAAHYQGHYAIELYDDAIWAMDPRTVMQKLDASLRSMEEQALLHNYTTA